MGNDLMNRAAVEVGEAIYDYSPQNDGDIELHKGDTVEILEKPSKDWWMGSVNGKTGAFPSNYVQLKNSDIQQNAGDQNDGEGGKHHHHARDFGKRIGNATIFGAGATIGNDIVNSIL
ncbi:unnamed protein product [Kuraishia capsulata CBS 1993]|uniref:SH3 domain-containing protein n=1 Tax=Kuraishia capsulata CBS 1993 TaxID=1382522 RepID=W6MUP4_9ASCO|nr:uncharacterized protein KUCA_T00005440001 [Kuraishia capsulata CBS 1993]CDK29452.1 unnamed protein product [Kuraishia capsulata CBS 1993]